MSLTEEQEKELREGLTRALRVVCLQQEMIRHADTLITHLARFIKDNQLEPPVPVPEKYYVN
jgi:hypothetical protein